MTGSARRAGEELVPAREGRVTASGGAGFLTDLLELVKVRISVLVTGAAAAAYVAAGGLGAGLWHLAAGTALLAGGTNALNQVMERDADARMDRTRGRPLPDGRISTPGAAAVGVGLVTGGTAWLLVGTHPLTAALGLGASVLYLGVYTPLKRRSAHSLIVGAVPGALPALGGWAAARGRLDAAGVALFGVMFLWQLPHFLALGRLCHEEYRAAGFAVLPVGDGGHVRAGRITVLSALALLPVSVVPALLGTGGIAYVAVALAAGAWYLKAAVGFGATSRGGSSGPRGAGSDDDARDLFRVSLYYLPVVLGALVLDDVLLASGGPRAELLPGVNAGLNTVAAICLAAGFLAIREGRVETHRTWMISACAASALFLGSYLVYHARVGSVPFDGTGWVRGVYLAVLASHVILAVAVVPAAIVTVVRGLAGADAAHRRVARKLLPVWMYVSVTGVVVYWMVHG